MPDGLSLVEVGVILANVIVALVSVVLNRRAVQVVRDQTRFMINDEFRKAYRELIGKEPGPEMDRMLDEYEKRAPSEYRERVRRIRELQKRSQLYKRIEQNDIG